ncbi:MAG: hypothetical protein IT287_06900 [Bdellovibrionaceae bacterium]|nr:hypothetical protein [Pseudobdellovibrionaceae bacterium]
MTQQKRILIGGFVLNFIVYLLAAAFFSHAYYTQNQEQLGKLAMVTSKVFQAHLMYETDNVKNVLDTFYNNKISISEKILWPQNNLFKISGILKKGDRKPETLLAYSPIPGIPVEVYNQENFDFIQFGQDKRPYVFNTLNIFNQDDTALMGKHSLVFRMDMDLWKTIAQKMGFNYSLIEYSSQMNTQTVFTDLTNELAQELQTAAAYLTSDEIHRIQADFFSTDSSRFKKIFSFSGTKTVLYPLVITNTQNIHQVLFYSFPLENYREVDAISILLFVLALFCVSAGTFVLGFS